MPMMDTSDIVARAVESLHNEIDRQVMAQVEAQRREFLVIAGVLAARSPDGVLRITMEEWMTAKQGRLVRRDDPNGMWVEFTFEKEAK